MLLRQRKLLSPCRNCGLVIDSQRWQATAQKIIPLDVYNDGKTEIVKMRNEKADPQGARPNRTIEFYIWFR